MIYDRCSRTNGDRNFHGRVKKEIAKRLQIEVSCSPTEVYPLPLFKENGTSTVYRLTLLPVNTIPVMQLFCFKFHYSHLVTKPFPFFYFNEGGVSKDLLPIFN